MAATIQATERTLGDPPIELSGCATAGRHDCWGGARVLTAGETVAEASTGEILVVDDLVVDHLPFLPAFVGVVMVTNGPWEGVIPGTLVNHFPCSALGALLRLLDIPCTWNVPLATTAMRTGDLIHLDPSACTLWCLPLT